MNLKHLKRHVPALLSIAGSVASVIGLLIFLGDRLGISSELSFSVISTLLVAAVALFAKQLVSKIRRLQRSPRVFLSYSSLEKPLARQISAALREAGAKVWIDEENLRVGESIIPSIERALGESDAFLVLLAGEKNPNVLMELGMARAHGLKIVPVVIGDAEIPSDLAGVFYLKPNGEDREIIERVVEAVT